MNCASLRLRQANLMGLQSYDSPGNVRGLQNRIEQAVIISQCSPPCLDLTWENKSDVVQNFSTTGEETAID